MSYIPKETREKAKEIYGYKCVLCGRKGGLHHHHTWLKDNPYDKERPELLPPLCDTCHGKIENRLGENLLIRCLRWVVRRQIERMDDTLEQYLNSKEKDIESEFRCPFGEEEKVAKKMYKKLRESA